MCGSYSGLSELFKCWRLGHGRKELFRHGFGGCSDFAVVPGSPSARVARIWLVTTSSRLSRFLLKKCWIGTVSTWSSSGVSSQGRHRDSSMISVGGVLYPKEYDVPVVSPLALTLRSNQPSRRVLHPNVLHWVMVLIGVSSAGCRRKTAYGLQELLLLASGIALRGRGASQDNHLSSVKQGT